MMDFEYADGKYEDPYELIDLLYRHIDKLNGKIEELELRNYQLSNDLRESTCFRTIMSGENTEVDRLIIEAGFTVPMPPL